MQSHLTGHSRGKERAGSDDSDVILNRAPNKLFVTCTIPWKALLSGSVKLGIYKRQIL